MVLRRLLDWLQPTARKSRPLTGFLPLVEIMEERTLPSFATPVSMAAQSRPASMVVVDLNLDGKLDFVTANNNSASLSVFLGKGDGTFADPVAYRVNSQPMSVVTGDFNGDGKPDLAVANANPYGSGNSVTVITGKGDGTLKNPVTYAVGSGPSSLAVADFTGDGRSDLVVTNTFSANIALLAGKADGTFKDPVYYPTGTQPRSVATADFNGDGVPDLAVANSGNNTVGILLNRGGGTFQTKININTGTGPVFVLTGDFNNDNEADIAVADVGGYGAGGVVDLGHVCVLLGNGDGTFQDKVRYDTAISPSALVLTDINGDLVQDLVASNQGSNTVTPLLGNGTGTFRNGLSIVVGTSPGASAAGDFNGDKFPDMLVAVSNGANNLAFLKNQADASVYNGSPNQRFVAQVYLDLLERPVDSSGLQTWTGLLDNGRSRSYVVGQIEASPEYRMLQIRKLYQELLGRAADTAGMQTQLAFLSRGGTLQQLRAVLLGSTEYFNRAGGSNAGFLQALYPDVLGRPIDAAGGVTWADRLTRGASRSSVAAELMKSEEARQRLVLDVYQRYLRRTADDGGLRHFTNLLGQGMTTEQLMTAIVGSDEYFARI